MPSLPALFTLLFGLTSLTLGTYTLLSPTQTLTHLSLPPSATPSVAASSLAAIAMGAFYLLAGYQENRAFFKLSLATRSLTAVVLWRFGAGWRGVAAWEGVGVLVTGLALGVESSGGRGKGEEGRRRRVRGERRREGGIVE